MAFEFDHAVCRPCPKDGRCVGLTGAGDVASVTGLSAANGGEITMQIIPTVGWTGGIWQDGINRGGTRIPGAPLTKYAQAKYVDAPLKGFDMGYIKMQAIGPGQCVRKAELIFFAEGDGRTNMFPDRPKLPVAAHKLVNKLATPRFEVLGVIGGREILKKSKKCNTWWKKKVKNARKLKKKCTAK